MGLRTVLACAVLLAVLAQGMTIVKFNGTDVARERDFVSPALQQGNATFGVQITGTCRETPCVFLLVGYEAFVNISSGLPYSEFAKVEATMPNAQVTGKFFSTNDSSKSFGQLFKEIYFVVHNSDGTKTTTFEATLDLLDYYEAKNWVGEIIVFSVVVAALAFILVSLLVHAILFCLRKREAYNQVN